MSGRKNTLLKFHNVTNGDMSSGITSTVTNIQYLDNVGIQLNFTGSPTGTFFVDVSVDYAQSAPSEVQTNVGNWIPISLPSTPVAAGSAGFIYLDLNQLSAPWIRVRYVPDSGSGVLNAYVTAKEI